QLAEYFNLVSNQKKPVTEAIRQAWGVEPKQFDRDLHDYAISRDIKHLIFKLPNVGEDVTYGMRKIKDYEAEAIIADLHLHAADYFEKAGPEFEAILKKEPDNSDANRG